MSSSGTPVYESDYPNNPGVILVYTSSYPNNPGVQTVWMSNYPNNSGVQLIHYSSYPNNPGVQHIYLTGCFPKSELVNICSERYAPIGALNVGDKISCWNSALKKAQPTFVKGIHKYIVNDIIHINNTMRVSASHPLMVLEKDDSNILISKWKVALDLKMGDCLVSSDSQLIIVKSINRHWHEKGIEVINLSTDCGNPFIVKHMIARSQNAIDHLEWVGSTHTQKLAV